MPDGNYRVTIRDAVNAEYDIISIPFVGGACVFDYTSDLRPATVHLDPSDMGIHGVDTTFSIVGDSTIKIYRVIG